MSENTRAGSGENLPSAKRKHSRIADAFLSAIPPDRTFGIPITRILLAGAVGYIVLLLVFWFFFRPESRSDWKDINQLTAQIIGGAVVVLGLYFAWRNIAAVESNVQLNQASLENQRITTQENTRLGREGQITERFTRAVEQLGSDKVEVRIGGIFALERIAFDSPRDHAVIMETLTAFIRHNAPYPLDLREHDNAYALWKSRRLLPYVNDKPREDIQTALTVIGRRDRGNESDAPFRINLSATNLMNADFSGGHFEQANFHGTNLMGANFSQAHFEYAHFNVSRMEHVLIFQTYLEAATFNNAHLHGVIFQPACGPYLQRTDFSHAHLEYSAFWGALCEDSKDTGEMANFRYAWLDDAQFFMVDLRQTSNLTQEQKDTCRSEKTKWPAHLDDTGPERATYEI